MSYCNFYTPKTKFNNIRIFYQYLILNTQFYSTILNSCTTTPITAPNPTPSITGILNSCTTIISSLEGFSTTTITGHCELSTINAITSVRATLFDSTITGACEVSLTTVSPINPPSYVPGLFQETITNNCITTTITPPNPASSVTEIQNSCTTMPIILLNNFNTIPISGNCSLPPINAITDVRTTSFDFTITGACINASI
jgi:hypothetical protein